MKQTVFGTPSSNLPPASFLTMADALDYAREYCEPGQPGGVIMCPPASFDKHYTADER